MDYIKGIEKYLEIKGNIRFLKAGPYNAIITNETDIEEICYYGEYPVMTMTFVFDTDKLYKKGEIIDNCFNIYILYEKKKDEFQNFIDNIKTGKFAVFCSIVDEEPYFCDYPRIIIAYPYQNKVRFIQIDCDDATSLDLNSENETIEHDLLFNKQELIKTLEKLQNIMEKENIIKNV